MDPFLGEIKLVPYDFAPQGWAFCQGQILSIVSNTALFSVIGTIYGGNGTTNFALPDLRGRVPISFGQSTVGSVYEIGETGGTESVVLEEEHIPNHIHTGFNISPVTGTQTRPGGEHLAGADDTLGAVYSSTGIANMTPNTLSTEGKSMPHENRQPSLALNYVIALSGIFPPRGEK